MVGEQEDLIGLSPAHPHQGLEDAKAGAGTFGHSPNLGGEGEVGIIGDTKKLRGPAEGKSVAIAGHRRVEPRLVCVGGKQGAVAFVDGDLEAVVGSPLESVSCLIGHALRGVVNIVVRDNGCEVVYIGTMEVCSVGVVGNEEVKEARGND